MKTSAKILSLVLALIMALAVLSACGGEEEEETKKKKKKKDPTEATDTVPETEEPDHEHEWDSILTREPTCREVGINTLTCITCGATKEEEIPKSTHGFNYADGIIVEAATPEKDGLKLYRCSECGEEIEKTIERVDKWVHHVDSLGYCSGGGTIDGVYRDYILDASGSSVYVSESGEDIKMYANGLFISSLGEVQYLKKVDGTVICSTESLGISGFGLTNNNEDYCQFFEDGYIFAYDDSDDMKIGILGTDGEWIVPISEDNPIIKSGVSCTVKQFVNTHYYYYIGDGVLVLPSSKADYDVVLYNIEDNKIYDISVKGSGVDVDYIIKEKCILKDSVAFAFSKSSLCLLSSNGDFEIKRLDEKGVSDVYVDRSSDYYFLTESAVYKNGEVYIELEYKITSGTWIGENCLVLMEDPSGDGCFGYMTKDGEFLFDPVKTDAVYACDVSGIGAGSNISDGEKIVVDDNGTVYYTSENAGAYIYVNNNVVEEELRGAISNDYKYTPIDVK